MASKQDVLNKLYSQDPGVERIRVLFQFIEEQFATQNLTDIDQLLQEFDPTLSVKIVNTGILRATCRAKKQLNNWVACRDKVRVLLDEQGENTSHVLRGLI